MDREYGELSLAVGMFCGAADEYLGRDHFFIKVRSMAWDLTPELFAELKREARDMGIPDHVFELTVEEKALFPKFVTAGIRLQDKIDN